MLLCVYLNGLNINEDIFCGWIDSGYIVACSGARSNPSTVNGFGVKTYL